jgi:hypothetical protein
LCGLAFVVVAFIFTGLVRGTSWLQNVNLGLELPFGLSTWSVLLWDNCVGASKESIDCCWYDISLGV